MHGPISSAGGLTTSRPPTRWPSPSTPRQRCGPGPAATAFPPSRRSGPRLAGRHPVRSGSSFGDHGAVGDQLTDEGQLQSGLAGRLQQHPSVGLLPHQPCPAVGDGQPPHLFGPDMYLAAAWLLCQMGSTEFKRAESAVTHLVGETWESPPAPTQTRMMSFWSGSVTGLRAAWALRSSGRTPRAARRPVSRPICPLPPIPAPRRRIRRRRECTASPRTYGPSSATSGWTTGPSGCPVRSTRSSPCWASPAVATPTWPRPARGPTR